MPVGLESVPAFPYHLALTCALTLTTLLLLAQGARAARSWPVQREGDSGRNVVTIQYLLRARGYSLSVDGAFGPTTKSRVMSFQSSQGLSADGIVGTNSGEALIITVRRGARAPGSAAQPLRLLADHRWALWGGYRVGGQELPERHHGAQGQRSDGAAIYQDGRGNKFYRESNHWDILFP